MPDPPVDLIIVRGTPTQFKSIPNWDDFAFHNNIAKNNHDGTFSIRGLADAAGQTDLTNLGFTVTVEFTEAEYDQHYTDVDPQFPV